MYKVIVTETLWGSVTNLLRVSNNTSIPFDSDNTDYQEYLQWLAEGNEPLPADEPEGQTV